MVGIAPRCDFHIAPMQCYTNQPMRKLSGLLSPSSIKWTEMEKVDDLLPNIEKALHKRLDGEQDDKNLVLQLGSNDPDKLESCVRAADMSFSNLREINLNCGCPAVDTGGASTYGASLMKDSMLTTKLVESMSSCTNIMAICKPYVCVCTVNLQYFEEIIHNWNKDNYSSVSCIV